MRKKAAAGSKKPAARSYEAVFSPGTSWFMRAPATEAGGGVVPGPAYPFHPPLDRNGRGGAHLWRGLSG